MRVEEPVQNTKGSYLCAADLCRENGWKAGDRLAYFDPSSRKYVEAYILDYVGQRSVVGRVAGEPSGPEKVLSLSTWDFRRVAPEAPAPVTPEEVRALARRAGACGQDLAVGCLEKLLEILG